MTIDQGHRPRAVGGVWLCVLAGRSGSGKTTLGQGIARATGACYLRVDAVETALSRVRDDVGADGYVVVHEVAASNLQVGNNVVVDAVNPVPEARAGWRDTADRCGALLIVLETWLPDADEHRRRVEARRADIPGHQVPTWREVQADGWVPWCIERDGSRTLIDTTSATSALHNALSLLPQH